MATDIYQKIEQDFGDDAAAVHRELSTLDAETKGLISDRLIRSIIYLSQGNLQSFRTYIEMARLDWRDVLWHAECDPPNTKIKRDFTKTFHELKLYAKKA